MKIISEMKNKIDYQHNTFSYSKDLEHFLCYLDENYPFFINNVLIKDKKSRQ